MTKDKMVADTHQARWAQFRFSIIGPLLSAPPEFGELKPVLEALSKKQWRHPITGVPVNFSFSTLERWLYRAKKTFDPVNALRTKRRTDAACARKISAELKRLIQQQYREHPGWSYQLHIDNLLVRVKEMPELGPMPSYSTVHRYTSSVSFLGVNLIQIHRSLEESIHHGMIQCS